jgi:hypothetical protein
MKNIFLIICCFLLLCGRALAVNCSARTTSPFAGWTLAFSAVYSTSQYANVACNAAKNSMSGDHGSCEPASDYYYINNFTTHSQYVYSYCPCSNFNSSTGQCLGNCAAEKAALSQQCGGDDRYVITDQSTCAGKCVPPCSPEKVASAVSACGDIEFVVWESLEKCEYHCNDCDDEYKAAKQKCDNPILDPYGFQCSYICTCVDIVRYAEVECPYGYDIDASTCKYGCRRCPYFTGSCVEKCAPFGGAKTNFCHETDGDVDEVVCECNEEERGCDAFWTSCSAACKGRGGTGASSYCNGSGGSVLSKSCVCGENETEKPEPPPEKPEEPEDPDDDSDLAGWLKAIKENTDIHNNYLDNISENIKRGVFNQEILNKTMQENFQTLSDNIVAAINGSKFDSGPLEGAVNGVRASVNGVKDAVDGVKGALGPSGALYSGLKDVNIAVGGTGLAEAGSLGTGGEVTGSGYGSEPSDADLPTAQQTASAFGTFQPRPDGEGYRAQIKGIFEGFDLNISGATCHYQIPFELFNYTLDLDFCPYEALFNLIGSFLVVLTSLYVFSSFV